MQKIFTSLLLCLALAASVSAQPTARWYSYNTFLDTMYHRNGGSSGFRSVLMWPGENFSVRGETNLSKLTVSSAGTVFVPWAPGFNDPSIFPGAMSIDSSTAYSIDTIRIYGRHNINPAKTWVVDTILVATLHDEFDFGYWDYISAPSFCANYGVDTIKFSLVGFDSVANTAISVTSTPANYQKIPITAAMWGDTLANGTFVLTVPVNINAGPREQAAMSLTFISGDNTYPGSGDTIENFTGTYMYNSFYPIAQFQLNSAGDTTFPYYHDSDRNEGIYIVRPFFENGWSQIYQPMSSFVPTSLLYRQHLSMDWHVTSSGGGVVGVLNTNNTDVSVSALPNPANTTLAIKVQSSAICENASATLHNVLGQVVATQSIDNNVATFNTSSLPSGLYTWSVKTGKKPVTGSVTIVH